MGTYVNIAAYKFAPLENLKPLRESLLGRCRELGLKGTILLSTEGINLFLAGGRDEIAQILMLLRSVPGLEDFPVKSSESDHQPFNRMLVRIKREIIAFGVEGIEPAKRTAPKLSPAELKTWLDEGRPVTLLDTRNEYEIKLGTFRNAVTLGIDHFRDFPAATQKLSADLKTQPIVMFCTGGIRCEKAGPFMQREGFENVYQLDGGILKYFEDCGSAHYEGECFVFDQRVGLDPTLAETESDQCFACLTPLTKDDLADPRYRKGIACPYCDQSSSEALAQVLEKRHAAIKRITNPLPGREPYCNYRPLLIPATYEGRTLEEFLMGVFGHIPRDNWQQLCRDGRIQDREQRPVQFDQIVHAGERYLHYQPQTSEPDVNANIEIVFEDEAIIVVNKPAPLPVHASGRFHRNTLQWILHEVYKPQCPRPAHRLDANTSGLMVFARTRHFASLVQSQFVRGEVEKTYLARVQGLPTSDEFVCKAPISKEAGALGSRTTQDDGLPARTEFRVIKRFDDSSALLEACLKTGRTNQIRVHLWDAGWPIRGEQSYLADRMLGDTQTHDVSDPPLCLCAYRLAFTHPLTNQRMWFATSLPGWAS